MDRDEHDRLLALARVHAEGSSPIPVTGSGRGDRDALYYAIRDIVVRARLSDQIPADTAADIMAAIDRHSTTIERTKP